MPSDHEYEPLKSQYSSGLNLNLLVHVHVFISHFVALWSGPTRHLTPGAERRRIWDNSLRPPRITVHKVSLLMHAPLHAASCEVPQPLRSAPERRGDATQPQGQAARLDSVCGAVCRPPRETSQGSELAYRPPHHERAQQRGGADREQQVLCRLGRRQAPVLHGFGIDPAEARRDPKPSDAKEGLA